MTLTSCMHPCSAKACRLRMQDCILDVMQAQGCKRAAPICGGLPVEPVPQHAQPARLVKAGPKLRVVESVCAADWRCSCVLHRQRSAAPLAAPPGIARARQLSGGLIWLLAAAQLARPARLLLLLRPALRRRRMQQRCAPLAALAPRLLLLLLGVDDIRVHLMGPHPAAAAALACARLPPRLLLLLGMRRGQPARLGGAA